jgi:hypothetical protein
MSWNDFYIRFVGAAKHKARTEHRQRRKYLSYSATKIVAFTPQMSPNCWRDVHHNKPNFEEAF